MVSLPLTGAVCETVKIVDLRDGRARLDSLIKTCTRVLVGLFFVFVFALSRVIFIGVN